MTGVRIANLQVRPTSTVSPIPVLLPSPLVSVNAGGESDVHVGSSSQFVACRVPQHELFVFGSGGEAGGRVVRCVIRRDACQVLEVHVPEVDPAEVEATIRRGGDREQERELNEALAAGLVTRSIAAESGGRHVWQFPGGCDGVG